MKAIVDLAARSLVAVVPNNQTSPLPLGQAYFRFEEIGVPFDPATHREEFSHDEITGAKVIRHYAVIALTEQEIFDRQLELGYIDSITGIKLKTTEYAITKFSQEAFRLDKKIQKGQIAPSALQTFWDFTDTEREMPAGELIDLLLRYGDHCAQLFRDYAP